MLLESFAYNLFVQLLSIGTVAGSARVDEIKYCLLIYQLGIGMLVKICLYVDLLLFCNIVSILVYTCIECFVLS